MDDNELIEWLRTSGSDLDMCLDAADTIERLQRELLQSDRDYGDAEKRFLSESAKRIRAERERDEALAERDKLRDVLLSKHGGEPLVLLDELDEARAENEKLREENAELCGYDNYAEMCAALSEG